MIFAPIPIPSKRGGRRKEMSATEAIFAPIAQHRVTARQPETSKDDVDSNRCAALHNTLLLYGWVVSGKKIFEMKKESWWSRNGNDELRQILRPGLVRYLSRVFDVPGHSLFYHVTGLASPKEMLELGDVLQDEGHEQRRMEKHRFVVLYKSSKELVSHPAGLVYDQQTHRALLMPTYNHVFDLTNPDLPWQTLEGILSAWIDMVEVEKAVAIPDSVGKDAATPRTGLLRFNTRPWILEPYTLGDLHACIDVWKKLVLAIEQRAGLQQLPDDPEAEPLCSRSALTAAGIPRGFAYDLLSHAQHSQVWFIAPGIRLPKVEEFLRQPFKHILQQYPKETEGMKMPFLFLPCAGTVSAKDAKFRWPFSTVESVPCGLYLDAFPNAQNPFEDACRLVLPIKLGSNRYARTSDFRPILRSHSDLYQIGVNPFVMRHGPKLVAILENWLDNVQSGHWTVNAQGVAGDVETWKQADTRQFWWRYQSSHLSI
ncbi:hypothetical protein D0866_15574 [Hortaea werneckii]|uniref:Uncharacterized protein n=2 Tax=Hortaea werneckii TaxID=91943 RepID=A0A3M6YIK4_HORWE|nr:hypothetical protein D0866_15574 [Hortaea werneckii]